jgi:SAM-dependent methyltransferase
MVALGLLERDGDAYRNSEVAATFLAGRTPADLRPALRFLATISYPAWAGLADALRNSPHPPLQLDEASQAVFSAGVDALSSGAAAALANAYDFSAHRRLLDVAGGTGSWSAAVALRHPHMEATVFELPAVADIARERLAAQGLGTRVAVAAGDAMSEDAPAGHDVVLLANIIHYFSPEQNHSLLRRMRGAVVGGSRLLLADFWTDPTHTEPLMAALMAGEFSLVVDGDVYSVDEGCSWLEATGWRFVEHVPLAGPISLIAAEAA